MPTVLCFNPGSNSIKFDIIRVHSNALRADEGERLLTGTIDDIGKQTSIAIFRGEEKVLAKELESSDVGQATETIFDSLCEAAARELAEIEGIAVRVVHGGDVFSSVVRFDDGVRREIEARTELAPLHNPNSIRIVDVAKKRSKAPVFVAFDTAFHRTLPERAWRYPIDRAMADRHGIRKYGFHGLSHRYMMEHYEHLAKRRPEDATLITMHLESGCSITAIERGRSIETSMGFTPLEGLMMGTRSGSVDPAILPFLMEHEGLSARDALNVLEAQSGLKAISGVTLDTRILRERTDADSRLAMEIFSYRLRQMTGAYLAVLGSADAIVFGGGIGENTPEVRGFVCEGLTGWGVRLDKDRNAAAVKGDNLISSAKSTIAVWSMRSDEAMQLAYECTRPNVE